MLAVLSCVVICEKRANSCSTTVVAVQVNKLVLTAKMSVILVLASFHIGGCCSIDRKAFTYHKAALHKQINRIDNVVETVVTTLFSY